MANLYQNKKELEKFVRENWETLNKHSKENGNTGSYSVLYEDGTIVTLRPGEETRGHGLEVARVQRGEGCTLNKLWHLACEEMDIFE